MIRAVVVIAFAPFLWAAGETVVDFEKAVPLLADGKANRVARWEENGVVFTLEHEPRQTKGKGMLMFFTDLSSGHKGILCAMATEPIPVRATFPRAASAVTVSFWGSTGVPAVLEAFNAEGKVIARDSVEAAPGRRAAGEPVPVFTLSVNADGIAYVQFSGPREGEFLAADEVRFALMESGKK